MPSTFEELASKGAGKLGAASATLKGLRGVFRKLAEEHKEVTTFLKRLSATSDVAKRADLWSNVRRELLSHEIAETQEVYSVLQNHESLRAIVAHHEDEAQQLEALIDTLDNTPLDSPDWDTRVTQLETQVLHHAKREESEFFPSAQRVIGKDAAESLERRFVQAKSAKLSTL